MAAVTLQGVGKEYRLRRGKTLRAVENLNLEVSDGELLVLAGPSGCGKSSILRMIAGLESITSGEITIGNRMVNQIPARDRDVAMVFQNAALFPHWDVRKNLSFGLRMRKIPGSEIDKRIEEAVDLLKMDALLERYPGSLSGGERQRVALGRAIVRRPKLFLFDEPLSSLDAPARVQLRAEILRIHQRFGTPTIYVTHDQAEALTMGDRLAILQAGKIQQLGKPLEIYHQPANVFVAGFLGSPAMNFLRGVLRLQDDNLVFEEQSPGVLRLRLTAFLKTLVDCEVWLGLRPEDVNICPVGQKDASLGTATSVEHLGAETILHLHTGAHSLTSRVPAFTPIIAPGMPVFFQCDPSRAHLFEAASGSRLG